MPIQNEQAREVTLAELPEGKANEMVRSETLQQSPIEGLEKAVIQFTKVTDYTTFFAEYSVVKEDIIVHFFLTPELALQQEASSVESYWLGKFPKTLDKTAREYFQADFPRLMAKYTQELKSWWFKAQGYGLNVDPDAFIKKFFETLDKALES